MEILTGDVRPRFDFRSSWHATWVSRILVWAVGILALLVVGTYDSSEFDPTGFGRQGGRIGELLLAPTMQWDAGWFANIAIHGYDVDDGRAAFYPLYPMGMRALGFAVGSPVVAGIMISFLSLWIALTVIARLTSSEFEVSAGRMTVWTIALTPMSVFLSAVYSESLFLMLSAGTFLAARKRYWWLAGILGGLAATSRSVGLALLVPLAIMLWVAVRRNESRWTNVFWFGLVPLGVLAFLGVMGLTTGDVLAPFHAQENWNRAVSWPLEGVWTGVGAAATAVGNVVSGSRALADLFRIVDVAYLVAASAALVGVFRRFPIEYGAYAVVLLAIPLSAPADDWPLYSFPRFVLVNFPLYMWFGLWLSEAARWRGRLVLSLSALGLAATSAWFATGRFLS